MKTFTGQCALLFAGLFFMVNTAFSQFEYTYPSNNSRFELQQTHLILLNGEQMDVSSVTNDKVSLIGTKSGNVSAHVVLSTDGKTVCITPSVPFAYDETVTMNAHGLKTVSGKLLRDTTLTFSIRREMTAQEKLNLQEYLNTHDDDGNLLNDPNQQSILNLPDNTIAGRTNPLPFIIIYTNNNPAPGDIFINQNKGNAPQASAEVGYGIMQSNGDSVFYRASNIDGINFHLNLNGYLTAYRINFGVDTGTIVLDSAYNIINEVHCDNGLEPSQHDQIFFPDGTKWFTIYDWVPMDLSAYGGGSSTPVNICWIQELDANNNAIFQWRSDQHFQVTDAATDVFALIGQNTYDPWHMNSLFNDIDGKLIVSFRNMDMVIKVDPANGHIDWYWVGPNNPNAAQYNQFTVTNDPDGGFSHEHNVHRIANGDLLLFDNGNLHLPVPISKPKEYTINETARTANCTWYYVHPLVKGQQVFTQNQGSAERMPNGNTLIGYGLPKIQGLPNGTEIDASKNIVWEFRFKDSTEYSYRVYKDNWLTTGIANIQKGYENIQAFPNPSNGLVNLNLSMPGVNKISIEVINVVGQTVFSKTENYQSGAIALDLSALQKGFYILKISAGDKKFVSSLSLQ
jgi:Arylsulfotransferase (ASST)/Secretion system C-terminal sorting domain